MAKKKRKISKKKIFLFVIFVFIILFFVIIFNNNVTNIYISGNDYLTDQEIIDICKLNNYPNSFVNFSLTLKKRLEKNKYIYKAKVSKNLFLNKIYIKIEENYPVLYKETNNKTMLYNGEELEEKLPIPVLVSDIPNEVYVELIKKLKKIDKNILNRISEIEYKPVEIKKEDDDGDTKTIKNRFLLLMNDGNYVYITLDNFNKLNKYLDIIKYFQDEKGILNLDSGGYFDIFDK